MKKTMFALAIITFNTTNICLSETSRMLHDSKEFCPKISNCQNDSDCPEGQVCNTRWNGSAKCHYKACGKKDEFRISSSSYIPFENK